MPGWIVSPKAEVHMPETHLADRCHDEGLHACLGAVAVLLAEAWVDDILRGTHNLAMLTYTLLLTTLPQVSEVQKGHRVPALRLKGTQKEEPALLLGRLRSLLAKLVQFDP